MHDLFLVFTFTFEIRGHTNSVYTDVISMCMCGVCLRAISGGKSVTSKVWAHITKLRDKGGNTSNIMKYLLTKQHLYLLSPGSSSNCNSRDTHIEVNSAVELHSRDCTYSQSQVHYLHVF